MVNDSEAEFEDTFIRLFREEGYNYYEGSELDRNLREVVLEEEFLGSVGSINSDKSDEAVNLALKEIRNFDSDNVRRENKNQYDYIKEGVTVEVDTNEYETIKLIDFDNIDANEFTVVNQFNVRYRDNPLKTPDVVVFINGIPITVFELKGSDSSSESLREAYAQITDDYVESIPNLFYYNQFIGVGSRNSCMVGSVTSSWDWMCPWRYVEEEGQGVDNPEYVSMIKGLFNRERLLEVISDYVLFEEGSEPSKVVPTYYQYYCVEEAARRSEKVVGLDCRENPSARRIGTVSHSQGSGKSVTMSFYINKMMSLYPEALFIAVTDTNDLDEQLHSENFNKFGLDSVHVDSIEELRKELRSRSSSGGGLITTTIQKFQLLPSKRARSEFNEIKDMINHTSSKDFPIDKVELEEELSKIEGLIDSCDYNRAVQRCRDLKDSFNAVVGDSFVEEWFEVEDAYIDVMEHPILNKRNDIIVVSDEAHRSQDKTLGENLRTALPNSSQIGFTATPIYDGSITEEWFGEVFSSYNMDTAVKDNSVVKIDYENRAPELGVDIEKLKKAYMEEGSNKEEFDSVSFKDILKTSKRQEKIARDIVSYHNDREVEGTTMLVACDREAVVSYYRIFSKLREEGMNVPENAPIISNPEDFGIEYDGDMERKFKDVENDFSLAIVCKKWTTGFNVKHLHTMYIDKPLKGHNLVQTLGRVNRVYEGKKAGRIVDYVGIQKDLEEAFATYTTEKDIEIQGDLSEVEKMFERKFNEILNIVEIPDNIESLTDAEVDKAVSNIMSILLKKSEDVKFLTIYDNLYDLYRRIHPCKTTKSIYEEIEFLTRVASRLSETKSDHSNTIENKAESKQGLGNIIDQSVEAEETIQVQMVQNASIKKNITKTHLEINRFARGIKRNLEDQETYSLKTYNEVKNSIEETVKSYNEGRLDGKKAIEKLEKQAEKTEGERERSESLGLNNRELSLYDLLGESTELSKKTRKIVSRELDEKLQENTINSNWSEREDLKNEIQLEIYDYLKNYHNIENLKLAEKIIHIAEKLY